MSEADWLELSACLDFPAAAARDQLGPHRYNVPTCIVEKPTNEKIGI